MEPVSPMALYLNSSALSVSILAVLEFEIPINETKVMPTLQRFIPLNPRFSSIMVDGGNSKEKQWKKVEVDTKEHVKVPKFPSGLSRESYDKYLDEYLTELAMERFAQNIPLWEVHLIKYPTSNASSSLVLKFHHSLGDGYSLMGIVFSMMRRVDDPSLPLTFPSRKSHNTFSSKSKSKSKLKSKSKSKSINKASSAASGVWRLPFQIISSVIDTISNFTWSISSSRFFEDDQTPIRSGRELLEFHPSILTYLIFPLDRIKFVKNQLGVTVNDVVVGTIFLGTRMYMQEIDPKSSKSSCSGLALLNTRMIGGDYKSAEDLIKPDSNTPWGNRFAFLNVPIPKLTPHSNSLDFVWHARKTIQKQRFSLSVYLTASVLDIMTKLRGYEVAAQFVRNKLWNASMTISNMIGPVEHMSLEDHPVKGFYYLPVGAPDSLDISIMSYVDTIRIGFRMEKGLIDPEKFKSSVKNAFESIYKDAYNVNS